MTEIAVRCGVCGGVLLLLAWVIWVWSWDIESWKPQTVEDSTVHVIRQVPIIPSEVADMPTWLENEGIPTSSEALAWLARLELDEGEDTPSEVNNSVSCTYCGMGRAGDVYLCPHCGGCLVE